MKSAKQRKEAIIKTWRQHRWVDARLYWRSSNRGWRWDNGEIARIVDGACSYSFSSLAELENFLAIEFGVKK